MFAFSFLTRYWNYSELHCLQDICIKKHVQNDNWEYVHFHFQHDNWINTLDYDLKIYPNDIALLQLDTEVLDKSTIVPMATDEADDFAGVECTISGWGRNGNDFS